MMYRKFIATVLAVAVGVTGLSAAPARANNEDLLKILGGVAAIAIIGAAISEARDDDDDVARQYNYYNRQRQAHRHRNHRHTHSHGHRQHSHKQHSHKQHDHKQHGYVHRRDDHRARPLPSRVQRKVLPASCRLRARNRDGAFPAFSNWCLERKFRYSNNLPRNCATRARIDRNGRVATVYRSHCLGRYGYTTASY